MPVEPSSTFRSGTLGVMSSRGASSPGSAPTDGPPVVVAWATHSVEAEMWAVLLKHHGIPALVQRSPGVDVPDMLAAGWHTVKVRPDHAERAREILHVVEERTPDETDDGDVHVLARSPVIVVGAAVMVMVLLISALLSALDFLIVF